MTIERIRELREKASRARELAKYVATDERTVGNLQSYAEELETEATRLEEANRKERA